MPSRKEEDDDPVINEFDVYITPKLSEQLYLLQFPNRARNKPYNEDCKNKPSELRIKPQTGFIEMDVPLNTQVFYDKPRGAEYGQALSKSKAQGSKGHGIAVGFSQSGARGAAMVNGGGSQSSNIEGDTLRHQTLGGQLMHDERGKPNYMVGTFLTDKRELHLTGLDGVVQMRPQFHHIDARNQLERNKARQSKFGDGEQRTAQQVQMTFVDAEQAETVSTHQLLDKAHQEPWKRMRFFDEEETRSYRSYNERLFLDEDNKANNLLSSLTNERYLDSMSAPRLDQHGNPRVKPMTKKLKAQIDQSEHEEAVPAVDAMEQDQ